MESKFSKPEKILIICAVFIGSVISCALEIKFYLLIFIIILCGYFGFKKYFSWTLGIICVLISLISFIYIDYRISKTDILYKIASSQIKMKGRVISEPSQEFNDKTRIYFNVRSIKKDGKWVPANAKTILTIYDYIINYENIKIGDILEINGFVKRPYPVTNPGQFDYGKYIKNKGIFTFTSAGYSDYKIISRSPGIEWIFLREISNLKDKIINIHRQNLVSPQIEILGGMVFGNYAVPTPGDIKNDFIKSGLLHLLAASGMNVGLVFGIWFFFASKFKIPFWLNISVGILLTAVYSVLTGLPPSVVRAVLMMEFILIAKLLDRKADNTMLLFLVCALMLVYNPSFIYDIGFQLSFMVTFGLLVFIPMLIEKTKPVPDYISGAIWVPLVAQVFASPLQLYHFNSFSFYSMPANILVLPFVGIITNLGFAGSILSFLPFIGEKLCFVFDKASEPFISLLLFITNYFANLPNSVKYFPTPSFWSVLVFYIFLISFLFCIKNSFKNKLVNITSVVLIMVVIFLSVNFNFHPGEKKLEIVFFDVGEGDSIFVNTPENKHILIDTGPNGSFTPAKSIILPYLRKRGLSSLDALVLTHPDSDHTGGTLDIIKNIQVKNLLTNDAVNNTRIYEKIETEIKKNYIPKRILKDGEVINLDPSVLIRVIRPDNIDLKSHNEDSLILYIIYNKFSTLLMADCEAESLYNIKKYVQSPVNLIKIGHHGSLGAVNSKFLEYLKPEVSVISIGKRGYKRSHPHPQVIDYLKKYKSTIYRTDKDYAIKAVSDGIKTEYVFGNWKI
jgi:competence protein ComEC